MSGRRALTPFRTEADVSWSRIAHNQAAHVGAAVVGKAQALSCRT
jgi:hypothetical protein